MGITAMNPKIEVRSLKESPEECHGCKKPLGTHRTITVDKWGNPLRFASECQCYTFWLAGNATGFAKRGTALVAT